MASRKVVLAVGIGALVTHWGVQSWREAKQQEAVDQARLLAMVMGPPRVAPGDPSLRESVALEVLRGLDDTTTLGSDEAAQREQLKAALESGWAKEWGRRLTDACATTSDELKALVQPFHPGLNALERIGLRDEIPEGLSAPSRHTRYGLTVVLAEWWAPGRFCTNLEPTVAAARAAKLPTTLAEVAAGVWKAESSDGTAASILLAPDALPQKARGLVAFAPSANLVVLAKTASSAAVAQAAALATLPDVGGYVIDKCQSFSAQPLAFDGKSWVPWKPPGRWKPPAERFVLADLEEFDRGARACLFTSVAHAAQRLTMQRSTAPVPLPRFGFPKVSGGRLRLSFDGSEPLLVIAMPQVELKRSDGEWVDMSWEQFGSTAGTRLAPMLVDGAVVPEVFLAPTELASTEISWAQSGVQ